MKADCEMTLSPRIIFNCYCVNVEAVKVCTFESEKSDKSEKHQFFYFLFSVLYFKIETVMKNFRKASLSIGFCSKRLHGLYTFEELS